jgi:bacteriocin-like protein
MKTINLKGIKETLSECELKNVKGGYDDCDNDGRCAIKCQNDENVTCWTRECPGSYEEIAAMCNFHGVIPTFPICVC